MKNKKPKFESIPIDLVTFIGKLESTLMSFRKNKSKTVFLFRLLNNLEKLFNKLPVCKFSIEAEFSNEEKVLYYLIIISIMKSEKTIELDNYCNIYFNNYSLEMSLKKIGVKNIFYKVKQRPGKPLFFGKYRSTLIFGLPGNPAAVLSCFYEYVFPALKIMQGFKEPFLSKRMIPIGSSYDKKNGLAFFLKGKIFLQSAREQIVEMKKIDLVIE